MCRLLDEVIVLHACAACRRHSFTCSSWPRRCSSLPGPRGRVVEGRHPRYEPPRTGIDAGSAQHLGAPGRAPSSSVTAPEAHLAAALKSYADGILQPVAPSALGSAAGGLEPNTRFFANGEEGHSSLGESLGEALHVATDAFEATADGAKFAEEAETAEAVEPAAEGLGYGFAAVAFNEANAAFGEGAAPGEGGGGGSGSSSSAASYGEPHEQTFSGASYSFQAAGEFTLLKSTTDDLDIQVREQRFPGAADVALDTAAAMRVGGNIVELAANSSSRLELWVDRKAVAYGSRALAGGGKISVESPQLATVTWPDGTAVSVFSGDTIAIAHEVVTCNSSDNINVMVKVAPSRSGHLEGLLGDPGEAYDQLVGGTGSSTAWTSSPSPRTASATSTCSTTSSPRAGALARRARFSITRRVKPQLPSPILPSRARRSP